MAVPEKGKGLLLAALGCSSHFGAFSVLMNAGSSSFERRLTAIVWRHRSTPGRRSVKKGPVANGRPLLRCFRYCLIPKKGRVRDTGPVAHT